MEKIVQSVHKLLYVDFCIGDVSESMGDSLKSFVENNLVLQFPNDEISFGVCSEPDCNTIHSIRYWFFEEDLSKIDVDAMHKQLDELLSSWVSQVSIKF
jgi:hypothetical protein